MLPNIQGLSKAHETWLNPPYEDENPYCECGCLYSKHRLVIEDDQEDIYSEDACNECKKVCLSFKLFRETHIDHKGAIPFHESARAH